MTAPPPLLPTTAPTSRPSDRGARYLWAIGLLLACKGGADTGGGSAVGLPPTDTAENFIYDSANPEVDTGFGAPTADETPDHTVKITQKGLWALTPRGGPYSTVTGYLEITEITDGLEDEPSCKVTFGLTGESIPAEELCADCAYGFEVLYYLSDGELADCMDPDKPETGTTLRLAWVPGANRLYLDYLGTGVWIPWYVGSLDAVREELAFTWEATMGVRIEEEE